MLVAKVRRIRIVFALTVERKGAADPHLAEWVDETSAPDDHAGNGLAERAVGLVGGTARTLKNLSSTARCRYHQNRTP